MPVVSGVPKLPQSQRRKPRDVVNWGLRRWNEAATPRTEELGAAPKQLEAVAMGGQGVAGGVGGCGSKLSINCSTADGGGDAWLMGSRNTSHATQGRKLRERNAVGSPSWWTSGEGRQQWSDYGAGDYPLMLWAGRTANIRISTCDAEMAGGRAGTSGGVDAGVRPGTELIDHVTFPSLQHHDSHVHYYDVAMPPEAATIIREGVESCTPVQMVGSQ
ncbi:hypothetical protein DFH09DRAFT_1083642 [Mycena vulgaris]|nr:hypothetical protein DFH09DRAFT_1083642 [Mycena vulgaris]